jgi:hypothetical protein
VNASETADDYDRIVARIGSDWRIIECRDRLQWILQRRGSPKNHVETIGAAEATAGRPGR